MTNRNRHALNALIEAQANTTANERGDAYNALEFMATAIADLNAGDYAGFLCAADLAGQFARDARQSYYARKL